MITGLLIPPQINNPLQLVELDERDALAYRHLVGGDLEAVDWTQPAAGMYVDEHGKIDRLPANLRATVLWWMHTQAAFGHDTIAGPALVVGPVDDDGYDTDVPRELVDLLMGTGGYRIERRTVGEQVWRRSAGPYADWLDAYTAAIHLLRRVTPSEQVRVVADGDNPQDGQQ